MSLIIVKEENYIKPTDDPELLGWYRWRGTWGAWGKYHAFLLNIPENYKIPGRLTATVWSACRRDGTSQGAGFEENPPVEKRCKRCVKELKKLGIAV